MRWISALQLEAWARSLASEVKLPEIVADLILATAAGITDIRFPSGDKGRIRGFDGTLFSKTAALNVPEGQSLWEFGTDHDYKAKAKRDFEKRTDQVPPEDQKNTALVLVTPWSWDSSRAKLEEWIQERKTEAAWKELIVIDGVKLQAWLDYRPAVAARHARLTFGIGQNGGIRSTDEFWADFTGQFSPPLTEDVLLCERESFAQQVLDTFLKPPFVLSFVADTADEVVAFAIAAIRKAPEEVRAYLELRTLVVDTRDAGRMLPHDESTILLLRGDATKSPAQFAEIFSTLVPLSRPSRSSLAVTLPRPTGHAMGRALMSMGIDETRAVTYARGSGRSLAALARLLPGGESSPPPWLTQGSALLPCLLAGSWDMSNTHDKAALQTMAGGQPYGILEAKAREFLRDVDPPFDLEGSMWKVRAPMDAFMHIGSLIGEAQLERLRAAMLAVFGTVEPDRDPSELVLPSWQDPTRHSEWLREGLAVTLLLLAVWSEPAQVNLGTQSGQEFADGLIESLPGLQSNYRLLTSLGSELPLLAEAAPRPFLSALEHMLEGEGELIRPIFTEYKGFLHSTYRHTGVLWALETLAWDPEFFRRAVLILARLAALDPGVKQGNRPFSSLREIFVIWAPNTNASSSQKLAALDEIVRVTPTVGWTLVKGLLPTLYGTSTPTAKPRLREAGAADRLPVKYDEVWADQAAVVRKAISLAKHDVGRWIELVPGLYLFSQEDRIVALEMIDQTLEQIGEECREPLWSKLRDEVFKHERFTRAAWALPLDQLKPFRQIVAKYEPSDPVLRISIIFDQWDGKGGSTTTSGKSRRTKAIADLLAGSGVDAILHLVTRVKTPSLVLEALDEIQPAVTVLEALLKGGFDADPISNFTIGIFSLYRKYAGEEAAILWLRQALDVSAASPEIAVNLLLAWPDTADICAIVRRFGGQVQEEYWKTRPPRLLVGISRAALMRICLMLLRYGRPLEAIQSAVQLLAQLPSKLLFKILDHVVFQLNDRNISADMMTIYYIEEVLKVLDSRDQVPLIEIARREYAFLPILEFSSRTLRIHELMAMDAAFFQSIICDVFRPPQEPKREAGEAEKNRAELGYSLLSHFSILPGSKPGGIDEKILRAWIHDVRRLGIESDRIAVTESYIGKILAHAPVDADGGWPDAAVRRQIDELQSDEIDHGIITERFNMRGAHTRGLFDGGQQERDLSKDYLICAAIAEPWPRTASMLKLIAKNWQEHAKIMDLHAAQRKLQS